MSAVRLYFDADAMERGLLAALRARGVDAITSLEAGMSAATDDQQLEFARGEETGDGRRETEGGEAAR